MVFPSVAITDESIEGLRAFLVEGDENSDRLFRTESGNMTPVGGVLLHAAFSVAVLRKFSPTYTVTDIIRYVTDLRKKLGKRGSHINPRVAEHLIRAVLGDETLKDLEPYGADEEAMLVVALTVLSDLFNAADLNGPELDRFLQDAGDYAQRWLNAHQTNAAD